MLPFQPPFPNQNQVRGGNNPSLNQLPSSSNARPNQLGFNNPPMMMPPMGGFHNQNALLGSLLAQQQLIQGLQENLMAALLQQGVMPQFHGQQLNMFGGLQNTNLMSVQQGSLLGRPPLNQNPKQMTGFSPNGFLCSQNPNFVPNSQLPVMNAGIRNPAFLGNGNPQIRPSITNPTGLETQIMTHNPTFVPNSQLQAMNAGIPNPAFLGNGNPQIRPSITNSTGLETQIATQNPNFVPTSQLPIMNAGISNPAFLGNVNHQIQPSITNSTGLQTQISTQNPNFVLNSQLPVMNAGIPNPAFSGNGNHQIRPSITNSTGLETQIATHNLQQPIFPCPVQNNQCSGRPWPQMNLSQAGGINFSSNSSVNVASHNFKTKFNGPGKREPSNMSSGNAWKKERPFPQIEKRGQQQRNEINTQCSENKDSTSNICKRPLAVIYDESEVQRWRQARKRNFPTRTNVEKKLKPSNEKRENMDSDAEVRRQQLKEILAKQAELGVPVAEIPPKYLLEPKAQNSGNIDAHEASNTQVNTRYNKSNNKRGRFRRDNRNAKRQKFKNEESPSYAPVVKRRDPTLLRKLLNADIRQDKSQLLQAFRFMVLNSFFKNSRDGPLVFPIITAKDAAAPETAVVVANELLQNDAEFAAASTGRNGDDEEIESDSDDMDSAGDVVCEAIVEGFTAGGEKSEEGEITD